MNGWAVAGIVLIVILLITTIVFLILWLSKKVQTNNQNKELAISGVSFSLVNDSNSTSTSTVVAKWESVGNSSDQLILYADTRQINLDANGRPQDPTSGLLTSPVAKPSDGSVQLSGLANNTLYYLVLVVTNPGFAGFNPTPGRVYTSNTIPPGQFIISDLDINGSIALQSDNTTVTYSPQVKGVNDIFTYNTSRFTLNARGTGNNSKSDIVLYNNNGVLSAATYSNISDKNSTQWEYVNNQWCIKGQNLCMNLDPKTSIINVINNSSAKWQNLPIAQPGSSQ